MAFCAPRSSRPAAPRYAGRLGRAPFAAVAIAALLGGLGLRVAFIVRRRAARAHRA